MKQEIKMNRTQPVHLVSTTTLNVDPLVKIVPQGVVAGLMEQEGNVTIVVAVNNFFPTSLLGTKE